MLEGLLDDIIAPARGEIRPFSPAIRPAESEQFRGFSPNSPDSPGIKCESVAPLPADDLAAVTTWLDAINETDPVERARVLTKCATDPRALAQVLRHAREDAEFRPPPPAPKPRARAGLVLPFVRPRT